MVVASALDLLRVSLEAQGAVVHVVEASPARNLAAALMVAVSAGNAGLVRRILGDARAIPGFVERNGGRALEVAQRQGDRVISDILHSAMRGKHLTDDAGASDYRTVDLSKSDTARSEYKTGIGIDSTRGLWIHF